MYLVIAEKPSVSRAIAEVIGAQEREDGYLRGTDCMVSWCFGHLVEYVSPDVYDEKFSQWRYEDLPIIPKDWKVTVSEDKKDQFYILKRLLNSPEIEYVVNAVPWSVPSSGSTSFVFVASSFFSSLSVDCSV